MPGSIKKTRFFFKNYFLLSFLYPIKTLISTVSRCIVCIFYFQHNSYSGMNYLHCLVKCIIVRLGLLGLFNAMSKSGIKLCVEVKSILKSKLYWRAYEVTGNDDSLELGIKSFIMWLFYEKQLCLFFTVVYFKLRP